MVIQNRITVKRDLKTVKRDLITVKRDLTTVKRDRMIGNGTSE